MSLRAKEGVIEDRLDGTAVLNVVGPVDGMTSMCRQAFPMS